MEDQYLLSCVERGLRGEDGLRYVCGIVKDGEALAHCGQDDRFVIHLHLDEVGGDKVALVVDSNVQVVGGSVGLKTIRAMEKRG